MDCVHARIRTESNVSREAVRNAAVHNQRLVPPLYPRINFVRRPQRHRAIYDRVCPNPGRQHGHCLGRFASRAQWDAHERGTDTDAVTGDGMLNSEMDVRVDATGSDGIQVEAARVQQPVVPPSARIEAHGDGAVWQVDIVKAWWQVGSRTAVVAIIM